MTKLTKHDYIYEILDFSINYDQDKDGYSANIAIKDQDYHSFNIHRYFDGSYEITCTYDSQETDFDAEEVYDAEEIAEILDLETYLQQQVPCKHVNNVAWTPAK